jgi:hypothetical protein
LSAISSAWRAFCSTIRIEMPVRATSMIRSKSSSITMGETPAVGSSSISTCGWVISARPTATCWRCPPDKLARRLAALVLQDREEV